MKSILLILPLLFSYQVAIAQPEYPPKFDVEEALAVIRACESENNPRAYNPADPVTESIGLYQFKTETFHHFGERYGLPHDDIWSPEQQHEIAKAMIGEGRGETHWKLCWQVYKNYLN